MANLNKVCGCEASGNQELRTDWERGDTGIKIRQSKSKCRIFFYCFTPGWRAHTAKLWRIQGCALGFPGTPHIMDIWGRRSGSGFGGEAWSPGHQGTGVLCTRVQRPHPDLQQQGRPSRRSRGAGGGSEVPFPVQVSSSWLRVHFSSSLQRTDHCLLHSSWSPLRSSWSPLHSSWSPPRAGCSSQSSCVSGEGTCGACGGSGSSHHPQSCGHSSHHPQSCSSPHPQS